MKKLLILSAFVFALISCSKVSPENNESGSQPDKPKEVVLLSPNTLNFSDKGGEQEIKFTTKDPWTAELINSRASQWCSIYPPSGESGMSTIKVTASPNYSIDERNASIIIRSGDRSTTVTATQKPKGALTVTSSRHEVSSIGGEVAIEVKANIEFNHSIEKSAQGWIKYNETRTMTTSTLIFTIEANDEKEKREGKIYITSEGFNEEDIIYQEGSKPALVISKNEYIVPSAGETISIEVKSNVNVDVELPSDADWIKENVTRATSTNTYRFDIQPNETYDQRSAVISFTNKENNLSESVNIIQCQKDAFAVAKDVYNVSSDGDRIQVELSHNLDFDTAVSVDWITHYMTKGLTSSTIIFDVSPNDDYSDRSGIITFTSKDGSMTQTVTVHQAQKDALILSQNEVLLDNNSGNFTIEVQTNVDFVVTDPDEDWIRPLKTKGLSAHSYQYTVSENNSYDSREASIVFTDTKNNRTETVTVIQAQKNAIVLSKSSYTFGKYGGDLLLKVQTNVDIDITISDNAQDWILNPLSRSMNVQTLYFYIMEYKGTTDRMGEIILSADQTTQRIKIIQTPSATTGTQLTYTSTDGNIVVPTDPAMFGANIISNEYQNGIGTITFDNNINAIGENAFEGCTTLSQLTLPEGITSIGDYAFAGCNGLEYLSLPNTVISIGNYAFKDCTGEIVINCDIPDAENMSYTSIGSFEGSAFSKVTISNWVSKIGSYAFYGCNTIEKITIPESITYIGSYAFNSCSGEATIYCDIPAEAFEAADFTKVIVKTDVDSIGDEAFHNCENLAEINIENGLKSIGRAAFSNCAKLTDIDIPKSVNTIGQEAFYYCTSLNDITIQATIDNIAPYTFSGCNSISEITIPKSVTSIGYGAFSYCTRLSRIEIPENISIIESYTFEACESLTEIHLPESLTSIESSAFKNCKRLTDIKIPEGTKYIRGTVFYNCSGLRSIEIPRTITSIGSNAFYNCTGTLTVNCDIPSYAFTEAQFSKVIIKEGVTSIGSNAFYYCNNLKSLEIPSSVTNISNAFQYCTGELTISCNTDDNYSSVFGGSNFTSVIFSDNVTRIGNYLFYNNDSLNAVTCGSGITSIGTYAFYDCSNLHSVYCRPTAPPVLDNNEVFNYNSSNRRFYVPKTSLYLYKGNDAWKAYFDKIEGYNYNWDGEGSLENPDDSENDSEW